MSVKNTVFKIVQGGLAVLGLIAIFFIIFTLIPDNYTFEFYLNESGAPIDAVLFYQNNEIGTSKDGKLTIDRSNLQPGEYLVRATKNEIVTEKIYEISSDDLDNYDSLRIELYEADFIDITKVDLSNVELKTFELLNSERENRNIPAFIWDTKMYDLSKSKNEKMIREISLSGTYDYYAHTGPDGKSISDELKSAELLYATSSEDLMLLAFNPDADSFSKTISDAWMSSPGHRAMIIDYDNLWESSGLAIDCGYHENLGIYCISTFKAADFISENLDYKLSRNYLSRFEVYPEGFGLTYPATVKIEVTSDVKLDVYLFDDVKYYEVLRKGDSPKKSIAESTLNSNNYFNFEYTFTAEPGDILVLDSKYANTISDIIITYNV